jgi:hypothetical protein
VTAGLWRWEAYDRHHHIQVADTITDPWADTATDAAELGMARLMIKAAPDYHFLRGWQVRAWQPEGPEGWSHADDWLGVHEQARR